MPDSRSICRTPGTSWRKNSTSFLNIRLLETIVLFLLYPLAIVHSQLIILAMEPNRRIEQLSSVRDQHKVKVLILHNQKTSHSDFYFIAKFSSLIKLDFSYNKLSNFAAGFTFAAFPQLRILFLHCNKFASMKSVQVVGECIKLEYLTLFGNPLEEARTRHYFANQVPTLKLMDDKIIQMEERNPEMLSQAPLPIPQLSFPIMNVLESQSSSSFLSAVVAELLFIRQKFIQANPAIRIQRWFRRVLAKKYKRQQEKSSKMKLKISPNTTNVKIGSALVAMTENIVNQVVIVDRLPTEKMQVHKSHHQKISSLLAMNFQFMKFLKQQSRKKIFALKNFCELKGLQYQTTNKKLYCLRLPQNEKCQSNQKQIIYLLHSFNKFIVRRKGSENSMNFGKKFKFLQTLLKKKKISSKSFLDKSQNYKPNAQVSTKICKIQEKYLDKFVLIKQNPQRMYQLLKTTYHTSIKSRQFFPLFLEPLVERCAAAVSIQRMWRGYKARKDSCNTLKQLLEHNAAVLIQKSARSLAFKKRHRMLTDCLEYLRKQKGSESLCIKYEDLQRLEKRYSWNRNGINFSSPNQRWILLIQEGAIRLNLGKVLPCPLPKYLTDVVDIQLSTAQKHKQSNALDLLFKGVTNVSYFCEENTIKVQKSPPKTKQLSKSLQAVIGSSRSRTHVHKEDRIERVAQQIQARPFLSGNKYVFIQFATPEQALNRKMVLFLASYSILTHSFIKSLSSQSSMTYLKNSKSISSQISEHMFLLQTDTLNKNHNSALVSLLHSQMKSRPIKTKLFIGQADLTTHLTIIKPCQADPIGQNRSLALNSSISSIQYMNSRYREPTVRARPTAPITQQDIKIFPQHSLTSDAYSSQNASYGDFEMYFNKKYNRHYDQNDKDLTERSLDKSLSLQPAKNVHVRASSNLEVGYNSDKYYNTQEHTVEAQEGLRPKIRYNDNSLLQKSGVYDNEDRKKDLSLIRQFHISRIQDNKRYREEQLQQIKEKARSQFEENMKKIEFNRLDSTLRRSKHRERIKLALTAQQRQSKFEQQFMKKGNSSMRRQLAKFEHERSMRSSDNQSIEKEQSKDYVKKRQKKFHQKDTIKLRQYSELSNSQSYSKITQINQKVANQQIFNKFQKELEKNLRKSKEIDKSTQDLKKHKRMVHSVFLQQFYPLKQSKKLGFQLPRLKK